jgi:hypothetical protein
VKNTEGRAGKVPTGHAVVFFAERLENRGEFALSDFISIWKGFKL